MSRGGFRSAENAVICVFVCYNATMVQENDNLPIDARLLGDAVIELNISRRNVSIYPKGHPTVARSITKTFELLLKIFELRPSVTLAIAKDVLIIDDRYLDKHNTVYREFAVALNALSIASIGFSEGLTEDELYEFLHVLCERPGGRSVEDIRAEVESSSLKHVTLGFVDYDAFAFDEDQRDTPDSGHPVWEQYVYGFLKGNLARDAGEFDLREIPPEALAAIISEGGDEPLQEDSYDRVITAYMRRTGDRAFSEGDLRKILDFISGLRPELKRQFLGSTVGEMSTDLKAAGKALENVSADEVIELLTVINEQNMAIPDTLKNLLDKFASHEVVAFGEQMHGEQILIDDVFLSSGVLDLLDASTTDTFITESYLEEIQKLLHTKPRGGARETTRELIKDTTDEVLDRRLSHVMMELLWTGILEPEEYEIYLNRLKLQGLGFLETGQYLEVIRLLNVLRRESIRERVPADSALNFDYFLSREFVDAIVDSFCIHGRMLREEALALCDYFGDPLIPALMDAVVREQSQSVRKFLISLLVRFGSDATMEARRRLKDPQWFVIRNMLYIIGETGANELHPDVRPFFYHEHPKVRYEAVRTLLKVGDPEGVEYVRAMLESGDDVVVQQAITLCGAFRVKDLLPELRKMVRKPNIGGADFLAKVPVVKALGEIGDPLVLEDFTSLLTSKSLLYRTQALQLKEEIYRNLHRFSYRDIQEFVEAGLKSKNETIRTQSRRLQQRGGA